MSDESLDAENSTRNKSYDASDHLRHLIKLGHQHNSHIIKNFVTEHELQAELREILQELE